MILLFISVEYHSLVWIICTVTSWVPAWLVDRVIIVHSHLVVEHKSQHEFRHMIHRKIEQKILHSSVCNLSTLPKTACEKATTL